MRGDTHDNIPARGTHPAQVASDFYDFLIRNLDRRSRALVVDIPGAMPQLYATGAGLEILTIRPRSYTDALPDELGYWPSMISPTGHQARVFFDGWLGESETICVIQEPFQAGQPYRAGRQRTFRIATIDEMFGSVKRLNWLHLNDPGLLLHILRGARELLSSQSPVITMRIEPIDGKQGAFAEIHTLLSGLGYIVLDQNFQEISSDENLTTETADLLCFKPGSRLDHARQALLTHGARGSEIATTYTSPTTSNMGHGLPRVTIGLDKPGSARMMQKIEFPASALAGRGWDRPINSDGAISMGDEATTSLIIPTPAPGDYKCQLDFASASDSFTEGEDCIRIFAYGTLAGSIRRAGRGKLEFFYLAGPGPEAPLVLTFAGSNIPGSTDTNRKPRIELYSVELSW